MNATDVSLARRRLAQIVLALCQHAFTFSNEAELQAGIHHALVGHPLAMGSEIREIEIPGAGRIDFLVRGIGIEVKVQGSLAAVGAQVLRYLESPQVESLLLVTTKRAHLELDGVHMGKRVYVHVLTGGVA